MIAELTARGRGVAPAEQPLGFVAHCIARDTPKPLLQAALVPQRGAWVAIGPEGDFTEEEVQLATEGGAVEVSLGTARLRTETAGIAAVHIYQLVNSGLGAPPG